VVPRDMATASNAATEAADNASGHGSSEELTTAGGAVPGSASAGYLSELGDSWDDEIKAWSDDTRSFGTLIAEQSADYAGTDGAAGGIFGGLTGWLHGGGS
jgi:hypothetical protein